MSSITTVDNKREGAEIIYGAEACRTHSMNLVEELGFPKGVLPLKNPVECGLVWATGFVWIKQKAPYKLFLKGTATRVSYAEEMTAYVEAGKMKKVTGVKSKQLLMWVPITEMSLVPGSNGEKIYFKSAVGIGMSFPASAFADEEDEEEE